MSQSPTRIAIIGATGRMGTSLLDNADSSDALEIVVAVVNPDHPSPEVIGPGDIPTTTDLTDIEEADVAIDFSVPGAFVETARQCAASGVPLVSGTTGLSDEQWNQVDSLADDVAILYAANFSVGVNMLADLVKRASSGLGDDADIEIFEAHHRNKVDAPSGTAKMLGRKAAEARSTELDDVARWSRQGHTGERTDSEIGFQVLRGGDIVGEHTAYLCIEGERLELTHRATDRGIFARGALRAAHWLDGRKPGRYDMNDVLFG